MRPRAIRSTATSSTDSMFIECILAIFLGVSVHTVLNGFRAMFVLTGLAAGFVMAVSCDSRKAYACAESTGTDTDPTPRGIVMWSNSISSWPSIVTKSTAVVRTCVGTQFDPGDVAAAASDSVRPADGAFPDAASPPDPAKGGRRVWLRLARAAGAFLLFFAVGAAVGQWLIPDASDPAPLPIEAETPKKADGEMPDGPGMVRVQINATPWARIWVDGEDVGVTPLAGVELETGAHRFEARFPDGSVIERVQTVDPVNRWVAFP